MLSQRVEIPEGPFLPIEALQMSIVRFARRIEDEHILDFASSGEQFIRGAFRFIVMDREEIRVIYRNGTETQEFYLLCGEVNETESIDGGRAVFRFGTIDRDLNGPLKNEPYFTELLNIDTEMREDLYADAIEKETSALGGNAPKVEVLRLAMFVFSGIVEEYANVEAVTFLRDSTANWVAISLRRQ